MDIAGALKMAVGELAASGVSDPSRQASHLLAYAVQRPSAFIVAHPEYELAVEELARFADAVERRVRREPAQYITGTQEFYGLEFTVTPDVLIPRPETEILVERAIEILKTSGTTHFCEIGIGSGCISVAILANVTDATAVGVDVSSAALAIADMNAGTNGVSGRLELIEGDVFDSITGTFDLIVSNPPYVPEKDLTGLQTEVRDYEPRVALSGGVGGLEIIERIVRGAPIYLNPKGRILVEVGFDQSGRVARLFDPVIWHDPEFLPDLQGIPRIVHACLLHGEH